MDDLERRAFGPLPDETGVYPATARTRPWARSRRPPEWRATRLVIAPLPALVPCTEDSAPYDRRVAATDDRLITTFGRLLEASNRLERSLGAQLEGRCGIPHSWFEVLVRLARSDDGQLTMGALAEQVALTSGGITRLVDRIESAGLVERRASRADRRVSYVAITADGRAKVEEAAEVHASNLQEVFASFAPRDLTRLDTLLDRLRTAPVRP